MPIVSECIEPGCSLLCIDLFCISHEPRREDVAFPRGRPWPPRDGIGLPVPEIAAATAQRIDHHRRTAQLAGVEPIQQSL